MPTKIPAEKSAPALNWTGRPDRTPVQPFKQTPPGYGADTPNRIAPHDLFIQFTSGIILENKVFTR